MYNKDITICRKVILETIETLKEKQIISEFESEKFKIMEEIITLKKALSIIKN